MKLLVCQLVGICLAFWNWDGQSQHKAVKLRTRLPCLKNQRGIQDGEGGGSFKIPIWNLEERVEFQIPAKHFQWN
jgi:hypothetical protein